MLKIDIKKGIKGFLFVIRNFIIFTLTFTLMFSWTGVFSSKKSLTMLNLWEMYFSYNTSVVLFSLTSLLLFTISLYIVKEFYKIEIKSIIDVALIVLINIISFVTGILMFIISSLSIGPSILLIGFWIGEVNTKIVDYQEKIIKILFSINHMI